MRRSLPLLRQVSGPARQCAPTSVWVNDLSCDTSETWDVGIERKDGTVETDRSVGFRSDLTVVRVIGRFGLGFLYPSAICRITDVA